MVGPISGSLEAAVLRSVLRSSGVKVDGAYHSRCYLQSVTCLVIALCSSKTVPLHTGYARDTIQLLRRKTPDFVGPELWPPNLPDLNPVDYKTWG